MYTRTKHVSHLVPGKNYRRRGRNMPAVPTAPNRPAGTFRGGEAPQAPPAGRHPGKKQRPLPCPPCPASPGFVVVTARAAGRILTSTGAERGSKAPGRRELRSAEAAPSLPPRSCAAPAGPARRRAGRGGASAGREGSRDRLWDGPLRNGLPQNHRNEELGRDL